ncbi:MAG: ferritin family protein [Candidatus Latescibacterota bacterium]|nr:MAG: ferritin family protein [Candidatus Latescibacterota bacterium]
MENFKSVDEILDFAIKNEEEAYEFYTDLASRIDTPGMSKVFESFAKEEKGHKAKLLDVKKGKHLLPSKDKVLDLKIGDYLVEMEATPDMKYQDALILAMKKEKKAFKMYTDLAQRVEGALKNTFLSLAQEEAKHKLRFEIEYDDNILSES